MRALCLALLQRLQRLWVSLLLLARALFFAFFLLLRTVNSSKVVKCRLSLAIRVPLAYIRFLLRALQRKAALLAA
jgi:hypothetical protein